MPETPTEVLILPPEDLLVLPTPEPPIKQDFLVYYKLGGLMLVSALSGYEASEKVFALLHALVGKAENKGVSPAEASQVRLSELEAEIESVEAVEFPHDGPLIESLQGIQAVAQSAILREAFEVGSVSRIDLEQMGFDASEITDEQMEKIADEMKDDFLDQLYWSSLKETAEELGVPRLRRT